MRSVDVSFINRCGPKDLRKVRTAQSINNFILMNKVKACLACFGPKELKIHFLFVFATFCLSKS